MGTRSRFRGLWGPGSGVLVRRQSGHLFIGRWLVLTAGGCSAATRGSRGRGHPGGDEIRTVAGWPCAVRLVLLVQPLPAWLREYDPQVIIGRVHDVLAGAEVLLGRLHARVPE
jgi:hypothetical protein